MLTPGIGEHYECQACNTTGAYCCDRDAESATGFCTDFLDCDWVRGPGTCRQPAPQLCPVTTSSSQFSENTFQKLLLVDMGATQGFFDASISLGSLGSLVLAHNNLTLMQLSATDPDGMGVAMSMNAAELGGSNIVEVFVDIDLESSPHWDVTVTCPYAMPVGSPGPV